MITSSNLFQSTQSCVWGVDIGGANIKLCGPSGYTVSKPFPVWTDSQQLSDALAALIAGVLEADPANTWDEHSVLAVTMTAELADCFRTRREGVASILDQLQRIIPPARSPIYSVVGGWLSPDEARSHPWSVAASNWHALASWCLDSQSINPNGLNAIMDIGSTTVDIIPVKECRISTTAKTDRERMLLGQLVYTGMERTPVHAIVRSLTIDGMRTPIMAEKFATILDANLVLSDVEEEPDNCDTADGRPRTRDFAMGRLARMVGEDTETLSESSIVDIAREICHVQSTQIARALERNLQHSNNTSRQLEFSEYQVLACGHGSPIVNRLKVFQRLKPVRFVFLEQILGKSAARCTPALAVAKLCEKFCDWHRNN